MADDTTLHAAEGFGGDNFGTARDALRAELEQFTDDCAKFAAREITEENAGFLADLERREIKIRQLAEKLRDEEKAPFLAETRRLDGLFNDAKCKLLEALAPARGKLREYLLDLKTKREAAERIAREEADAARAAAAELREATPEQADVAEAMEIEAAELTRDAAILASAPVKVASKEGLGRSVGLKTVTKVVVSDWDLATAHVMTHPKVRAAVQAALDAEAKATRYAKPLPGCAFSSSDELAR